MTYLWVHRSFILPNHICFWVLVVNSSIQLLLLYSLASEFLFGPFLVSISVDSLLLFMLHFTDFIVYLCSLVAHWTYLRKLFWIFCQVINRSVSSGSVSEDLFCFCHWAVFSCFLWFLHLKKQPLFSGFRGLDLYKRNCHKSAPLETMGISQEFLLVWIFSQLLHVIS